MTDRAEERKGVKSTVLMAAASASLGGLIMGYDIGGAGGTFTMNYFREKWNWPPIDSDEDIPISVSREMGWIMSMFGLGAAVGATLAGSAADRLGRRRAMQLFAFIFFTGAAFQAFCNVLTNLYIGRCLGGIAVGGLSTICPMYLSEISPSNIRGALIAAQQVSITLGIFIASALNLVLQFWHLGWRVSYSGNAVFAIAIFFLMFMCSDSPRWLVKVGRVEDAWEALTALRHNDVYLELQDIIADEKMAQASKSTKWGDLFVKKRDMRFRSITAMFILGLQQFTGINVTFYYAPIIFSNFVGANGALECALILCFVNFVSTVYSLRLLDSAGRRKLMILGSIFMAIFSYGISILLAPKVYSSSIICIISVMLLNALYVATFELSWGPLGWVIPSEIFPLELRAKAVSLSTTCNWLCNFLIGRMTPILIRPSVLDIYGTYMLFASFCVGLTFFSFLCIPETKGIELEHMDKVFHDFRKNHVASRLVSIELPCSTVIPSSKSESGKDLEGSTHYQA